MLIMKVNSRQKKSKTIPIATAVILITTATLLTYTFIQKIGPFASSAVNDLDQGGGAKISESSPTDQEVKSSQDAKKNDSGNIDNEESVTPQSPEKSKSTVSVGISYADVYNGKLEIRAFTTGAIEGNGTCTATVSNSSKTIVKSSDAFIDATSTQCEPIYIPVSELGSGTWKVIVKFSAPDYAGTSEMVQINI